MPIATQCPKCQSLERRTTFIGNDPFVHDVRCLLCETLYTLPGATYEGPPVEWVSKQVVYGYEHHAYAGPSLYERLKSAWLGAVRGWREA